MARSKINRCEKCGGEGWLWWFELDEIRHYPEGGQDDTKYTCDLCHGEDDLDVIMESFCPTI